MINSEHNVIDKLEHEKLNKEMKKSTTGLHWTQKFTAMTTWKTAYFIFSTKETKFILKIGIEKNTIYKL